MPSRRSKPADQQTGSYAYTSASRKNLPTEQTEPLMGPDDKRPLPFTPEIREFDEQPQMAWARSPRLDEDGKFKPYEAHPLYAREEDRAISVHQATTGRRRRPPGQHVRGVQRAAPRGARWAGTSTMATGRTG